MEINYSNLTQKRDNGLIPALEVCRFAIGLDIVGEIGTRKYNSWTFEVCNLGFMKIQSPKFQEHEFSIDLENGDISVYRDYGDGNPELETTNNINLIVETYKKLGFEISLNEAETNYLLNL